MRGRAVASTQVQTNEFRLRSVTNRVMDTRLLKLLFGIGARYAAVFRKYVLYELAFGRTIT